MSDLRTVDPHRDGVRVVGVVVLREQYGLSLDPHPLGRAATGHLPERVLVVALAHDLEIVAPGEEHDGDGRLGFSENRSRSRRVTVGTAATVEDAIEQTHTSHVTRRE
jgi:hypothetical protein